MIDDMEKTMALMDGIKAVLPMRAFTTRRSQKTLRESSKRDLPRECDVMEIHYMGDEGGIACLLDFGLRDSKEMHVISITQLWFDRKNPFAREIGSYCKHRIKRIKKQHGGIGSFDLFGGSSGR